MKKNNVLNGIIYLYVILPVMIFLLGWTKWFIGIPGAVILCICWYRMATDFAVVELPAWNKIQTEKLIFVIGIILLWVYLSGIGKFVFQNTDHDCRNPIFDILVNYSWPVTKTMPEALGGDIKGLIYYIGFWLPAAVIGKIFGLTAGYCFQAVWAALGIVICYLVISSILKDVKIWPLLVLIFFSGLDIVGYRLLNGSAAALDSIAHLEWWSDFQFSSFTTQLFWVFNQALPAWVVTLVLYVQKKNRYIVLLMGCVLISSTLPFVGMIPLAVYFTFFRKYDVKNKSERWKLWFKDTFSFENVLGGGIAGIVSFLYLKGNEASQNIVSSAQNIDKKGYLFMYVIFMILEVGIYYIAVYDFKKKDPLYYVTLVWLGICPLLRVGFGGDFCMRASIPALLILCLLVMQSLQESLRSKKYGAFCGMIVLLLIGSVTPIYEINRTIYMTAKAYREQQPVFCQSQTEEQIFDSYNFSGKIEESFFYKYLGR